MNPELDPKFPNSLAKVNNQEYQNLRVGELPRFLELVMDFELLVLRGGAGISPFILSFAI